MQTLPVWQIPVCSDLPRVLLVRYRILDWRPLRTNFVRSHSNSLPYCGPNRRTDHVSDRVPHDCSDVNSYRIPYSKPHTGMYPGPLPYYRRCLRLM
jgi:hypothetical protein